LHEKEKGGAEACIAYVWIIMLNMLGSGSEELMLKIFESVDPLHRSSFEGGENLLLFQNPAVFSTIATVKACSQYTSTAWG